MRNQDEIDQKIRAMEKAIRKEPWRYEQRFAPQPVYMTATASPPSIALGSHNSFAPASTNTWVVNGSSSNGVFTTLTTNP
jgi:hypothetical protein